MLGERDSDARDRLIGALRRGLNVQDAARDAGLSRRQAYRWRDRDRRVAEAWPQGVRPAQAPDSGSPKPRNRAQKTASRPKATPRPPLRESQAGVAALDDPEFERKLRRLGLGTLASVCCDDCATDRDKVQAARYLVQLAPPASEVQDATQDIPTEEPPVINLEAAKARMSL